MRALDRKLIRDCANMRAQLAAIALVVMSGVAMYVTMRGSQDALIVAQQTTYATYRMADVFAHVKRAPLRVAREIAAIPGVAVVDARIVADVPLDVPRLNEPATGRVVSYDGTLNLLHIRRGRMFDPMRTDEAVASELFMRANKLDPGATIGAVLNGKWQRVRLVGIGSTPEFLNEVSGSAVFPDHQRFGVLWMPRRAVAAAFAMQGAFNDAAISLARGGSEADVVAELDRILARYGAAGAFGRDEQASHKFLTEEISQNRVNALIVPAIFLIVGAFLIHMVLSRLVTSQRDQIAILKAFGYTNGAIAGHYLGFALLVVVAGSIAGVPLGAVLGRGLVGLYYDFLNFPRLAFVFSPSAIVISIGSTAVAAAAAALASSLRAAAIPPAEGMRGERPPAFHATKFERLHAVLSSAARMIARSIERRPLRAMLASLGIAFAVMILIVGRFSMDALDLMIALHFRTAQRDDVTVTFIEPRPASVVFDLAHLPGVRRVEPFRAVPVRLRNGHYSQRTAVVALDHDAQLRRLVNMDGTITPIPPVGLVLCEKLARNLSLVRGSFVRVETLEGRRAVLDMPVSAIVNEMIGVSAYADRRQLARVMRESPQVSGAYLSIDSQSRHALNQELKRLPTISSSAYREAMLDSFLKAIARNLTTSTTAIIFFACLIAFAVVYNSARIALSERGRDLATLRVLGFSTRETGTLLLGEQAVLTAIGIPAGFLFGWLIVRWLVHYFDTDAYRLPLVVSGQTYAFALLVILAASVLSSAAVWRRIVRLDLVAVLKTRE